MSEARKKLKEEEEDDLEKAKAIVIKTKIHMEHAIFEIEKLLLKETKTEVIQVPLIRDLRTGELVKPATYVQKAIKIGLPDEIRRNLTLIVVEEKAHLHHIDSLLKVITMSIRAKKAEQERR